MISSSSGDSCSELVAGNYDVLVGEPASFKSILTDFLERFEHHESELEQRQQSGGVFEGEYFSEFKLLEEFSKTLKEDKANLELGGHEINLRKNRYRDIIPFNHTRVVLEENPGIPGSDYINANYIRGPSGSPRAYIACQGPLACTLNDFWRMIWECGVSVIVMACNETESGKPKCELYWPEQINSSQLYGNIQVTLVRMRQICDNFLIRKFSVKLILPPTIETHHIDKSIDVPEQQDNPVHQENVTMNQQQTFMDATKFLANNPLLANNNNNIESITNEYSDQNQSQDDSVPCLKGESSRANVIFERTICQFHYTTWPDHGVPDSVQPILDLVRLIRDVQPAEDKPILVHCSAGCGRTGTICCIDYIWGLLRQGKLDASFDLCSIISEMRQQRMSMVQTLEQYILCHRAVAALFMKQLKLIDDHIYENLDTLENGIDEDVFEDASEDMGPVFI